MLTTTEVADCFTVFKELRPHLQDSAEFVTRVSKQMAEGYQIAAGFVNDQIVACIGYRTLNTLAWGQILYIDDLITSQSGRNRGCGRKLLDYAIDYAKQIKCDQIHLDTGFTRHDAHKLYLNMGFQLSCHHMALSLI